MTTPTVKECCQIAREFLDKRLHQDSRSYEAIDFLIHAAQESEQLREALEEIIADMQKIDAWERTNQEKWIIHIAHSALSGEKERK